MIRLLQAPLFSAILGGFSFLLTMALLLQQPIAGTATSHNEESADDGAVEEFWKRHNPEIDQLLQEVKREKDDLARREAELRELAARLQSERAEINTVTQRVAQLQGDFDQNVIRLKEEEGPSLKRLARLYASMSPEAVLAILKELDDQTVVKLFSTMKDSESGPLLDAMARNGETQAKRAASLSEALRRTIPEKKKSP